MGTILAKAIVTRAASELNDEQGRRWSAKELLDYLNDGQRETGIHRPDAITVVEAVSMVQGSKQQLPNTGVRVIDAMCNAGSDGSTEGPSVEVVARNELDTTAGRNWRSSTPGTDVENVVFDGRYPTYYSVYPPQAGSGRYILLAWQKSPTDCTILNVNGGGADSPISLNDIYMTALLDYVKHRAWLKDAETRDLGKSQLHYNWFLQRLGLKTVVDKMNDLNRNAPPAEQSRQTGGVSQRAQSF